MSYLEELLPEFRNGAKIRRRIWDDKELFVKINEAGEPVLNNGNKFEFCRNINCSDWELYQEPIDWEYIIDHKCLCWFWDDDDTDGVMAILVSVYKDSPYRYYCRDLAGCGSSRKHFRPVRKDEVTFYEDKRDGNN
jgi:hypothetical protein